MLLFSTYYHIYNHANGDDDLFKEEKNYKYFLKKYHLHIGPIAETIAWCLMPNHFHLLVKIKSEEAVAANFPKFQTLENFEQRSAFLSKQFANFFSSYTQSFNKVYKRRGSLFIKNFKRKEVTDDGYLHCLILYIHLNPVKHGFTNNLDDWRWSSFYQLPDEHPEIIEDIFGEKDHYYQLHQDKRNFFEEYTRLENDLI